MASKRLIQFAAFFIGVAGLADISAAAQTPSAAEALSFKPSQPNVEYAIVAQADVAQCTLNAEKGSNVSAWVVRNRQGEILRRFADTNADNFVDQWCYYQNGLEVYRDIDSNFNKKADQYRWFHTAGLRWGIDTNEDGRVDSWRAISAHEVAEQIVLALTNRDPKRFELVLLTPTELGELGLGKQRADSLAEKIKAAPAGFAKVMAEQKIVTPKGRYVDFGSARPSLIPAGTAGASADLTLLDNASALVEVDGKHEQVLLGTLINVGDTWKLVDVPVVGGNGQPQESEFMQPQAAPVPPNAQAANAPSEEMQKIMAQLEQLDRQTENLPAEQQAKIVEQRIELLKQLAAASPESERDQWYRQLAGVISVAIQGGGFPQGGEQLNQLQQSLTDAKASPDLVAYIAFQRMWAEYVASQNQPGADAAKIQEKWLADLQAFVEQYPKSQESAEALLQLGMYQEFIGKAEEASKWYQQLTANFPKADPAVKAAGALRRLNSVGKLMQLRGASIQGGTLDLSQYRGKVVLIHYWATWCEPCKADMVLLKDVYAKRGGRDFQVIGVCLDDTPATVKAYLAQNQFPWKHIHEGGLDSRLANEMGVMTLPLMLLVDQKGNVAHANIHMGGELDGELNRLLPPAAAAAAARPNATRRR